MDVRARFRPNWFRRNSGTLLAAAVAALVALTLFAGGVRVRLEDDALSVGATFAGGRRVGFDEVRSVSLLENYDRGSRMRGVKTERLCAGEYLNDAFGRYALYAYARVPVCIDLATQTGHVVINAASEADTRALFDRLVERLEADG